MNKGHSGCLSQVRAFYANKDVFITGGTGFLGKVLIEKMLRSCPDIHRIFVLIRPKKGQSPADRLEAFTKDQVFDRLRKETPDAFHRMECVSGDVRDIGLGIDDVDFERIRKCSVVIHSAATVRFDELLTECLLTNTRGTRETLLLAQRMDHVLVFNHISTAFCNPEHIYTEEKLYPVHVDWRDAIKLAEKLDWQTFQALSNVYMHFKHPNTYTFSKRLSEHMANDFRKDSRFPIVILRPTVVSSTIDEPFPGWVDNFNGSVGMHAAGCSGLLRFINTSLESDFDYQPVDIVAKSIILSTWKEAQTTDFNSGDIPIYNSASCEKYTMNHYDVEYFGKKFVRETPLTNTVWYPARTYTMCRPYYLLMTIFCVAIPTNIVDFLAELFRIQLPMQLSRLVRKMFYIQESMTFFMQTDFKFVNERCMALDNDLHPDEYLMFRQDSDTTREEYYSGAILNARLYLLKDEASTIPRAKRNLRMLAALHYGLLTLVWGSVLYWGLKVLL